MYVASYIIQIGLQTLRSLKFKHIFICVYFDVLMVYNQKKRECKENSINKKKQVKY